MKASSRSDPPVSHERWLVSYADFVTLLFAFFVVLYASARIDQKKAAKLSGAIEAAFQQLGVFENDLREPASSASMTVSADTRVAGDPGNLPRLTSSNAEFRAVNHDPAEFEGIRAELEKALANEIKRKEVALHLDADGLVVSLREVGFFDSGSAMLKPGAEAAFSRVALILQEHDCAVRVEGHTDTLPIHTSQFASNWELSTARATGLVKSLIENHGVSAQRLSAAGYAEFHPVASNDSSQGRQLNRRVDIVILAAPLLTSASNDPAPDSKPKIPIHENYRGKTTRGSP
jgi:chemotaxis protein MotB